VVAFLDVAGVVHARWDVVAAMALVAVGLALVVGGWWGRARGLIAVGLLLTLVLSAASLVRIPLSGGVGDRLERPLSAGDLRHHYRLGLGKLTLDLTEAALLPGTNTVSASVGMGELVVIAPRHADVTIDTRVGAGHTTLFGREQGGTHLRQHINHAGTPVASEPGADHPATPALDLRLEVGTGQVEVRDGAA
jgi:hypothetical protein